MIKLPEIGAAVAWHQDPPYHRPSRSSTFPTPNFTTDIYLDDSDEENGCVYAIPGIHLEGHIDLTTRTDAEWFASEEAGPIVMEPGDVLFHALSTPHGSEANISDRIRRVFYIHYLCEEVYQDGYASEAWAKDKPGWSIERHRALEEMFAARTSLGLEPAQSENVELTENGLITSGGARSEKNCWAWMDAVD